MCLLKGDQRHERYDDRHHKSCISHEVSSTFVSEVKKTKQIAGASRLSAQLGKDLCH
jgi:hypothetical protein